MSLDLAPAIYAAIAGEPTITGLLGEDNTNPAIYTIRPVPDGAPYPQIIVNPDVAITDFDALNSDRPRVIKDVVVYGNQPDDYRTVETVGYLLRDLFHRQRFSISNAGYNVVLITVTGPSVAPVDDDHLVGRVVTLNIMLEKTS